MAEIKDNVAGFGFSIKQIPKQSKKIKATLSSLKAGIGPLFEVIRLSDYCVTGRFTLDEKGTKVNQVHVEPFCYQKTIEAIRFWMDLNGKGSRIRILRESKKTGKHPERKCFVFPGEFHNYRFLYSENKKTISKITEKYGLDIISAPVKGNAVILVVENFTAVAALPVYGRKILKTTELGKECHPYLENAVQKFAVKHEFTIKEVSKI